MHADASSDKNGIAIHHRSALHVGLALSNSKHRISVERARHIEFVHRLGLHLGQSLGIIFALSVCFGGASISFTATTVRCLDTLEANTRNATQIYQNEGQEIPVSERLTCDGVVPR